MANYYRYTIESADGHFETRDAAFESDTEARVKLFEWFIRQMQLIGIMLFKYDRQDTCGSFHRIDQYYKPEVIFF
ncbi:MAG: hypothetical protein IKW27_03705 [Bacteroidales bacterium]|nr:hypothetical protein [Bacteroidales bacterium]